MTTNSVYLTFDDGPTLGTKVVLDVLKKFSAHATFFVTGSNAGAAGGEAQQRLIMGANPR